MDPHKYQAPPFELIASNLNKDDDPNFWQAALQVLSEEFRRCRDENPKKGDWFLLVGACSHWVRPHQTRWTAAGGFAYPEGYRNSLPELDWQAIFVFRDREWIAVKNLPKKHSRVFRAALPTRTNRHKQAAVHTRWYPGSETAFYGFRNTDGHWTCVAAP